MEELYEDMKFQSTHPARGATVDKGDNIMEEVEFQSTHPARGATADIVAGTGVTVISIHAPREGCDLG